MNAWWRLIGVPSLLLVCQSGSTAQLSRAWLAFARRIPDTSGETTFRILNVCQSANTDVYTAGVPNQIFASASVARITTIFGCRPPSQTYFGAAQTALLALQKQLPYAPQTPLVVSLMAARGSTLPTLLLLSSTFTTTAPLLSTVATTLKGVAAAMVAMLICCCTLNALARMGLMAMAWCVGHSATPTRNVQLQPFCHFRRLLPHLHLRASEANARHHNCARARKVGVGLPATNALLPAKVVGDMRAAFHQHQTQSQHPRQLLHRQHHLGMTMMKGSSNLA